MPDCNTVLWDLQKTLPHRPPHRRVFGTESGFLLHLDELFNARLDRHVVQPYLKLAVECHEVCCKMPATLPSGLLFLPVRPLRNECLLLTFEKRPSHLKQQQSVACPGGTRFRPPKQQVVCRPLPVCPACSVPQLKKAQPHLFQASSTMFVSQALFRKVSDALAQTTRVCLCASSQVMSSSFLEEHRGLCDERFFSALPHSCSTLPLSNNHIV